MKSWHSDINIPAELPALLRISPVNLTLHEHHTETPRETFIRTETGIQRQDYETKHFEEASFTWQAVALEGEVTCLMTSSSIHTGRWWTRHIHALAAMPCIAWLALTSVRTGQIDTSPTVLTKAWCGTFIHIYLTLLASVARQTDAGELISRYSTCTSIGTRLRCTGINPLAILSCRMRTEHSVKKLLLWKIVLPSHYLKIIIVVNLKIITGKLMSAFYSIINLLVTLQSHFIYRVAARYRMLWFIEITHELKSYYTLTVTRLLCPLQE